MPPLFDEYSDFDHNMKSDAPQTQETPPTPEDTKTIAANTIFDYVELFALTVLFVLLATFFLFRHAVVVGPSMEKTLHESDHLIISDLFYTPAYGDIVIFESYEETGIEGPIIKRVIATEGQTVTISNSGVAVDGKLLDEDGYVNLGNRLTGPYYISYLEQYAHKGYKHAGTPNADGTEYTFKVGEGEIFVMGDNRFHSDDSRLFGAISVDCVLGRVLFRIAPIGKFGGVD